MAGSENDERPDALISPDDGRKYWAGVNADVSGMLGGLPSVSRVDLQGSRTFLARLGVGTKKEKDRKTLGRVLEGGAGWVHLPLACGGSTAR